MYNLLISTKGRANVKLECSFIISSIFYVKYPEITRNINNSYSGAAILGPGLIAECLFEFVQGSLAVGPLVVGDQRHVGRVVPLIGHVQHGVGQLQLGHVQLLVFARCEGVLTEQLSVVTEIRTINKYFLIIPGIETFLGI